jgi:hypothetical protein
MHLLAFGEPNNVVQDGVYPHSSDHGPEGLASGPEATVQGRPYTGSDGGGRAGFWPAALKPLSKAVLTPAQTAVAVQISGQRP